METPSTHHSQLKNFQWDFSGDIYAQVDSAIKALKLNDINTEELLEEQRKNLIKRFLLEKVDFSEPAIVGHSEKTIDVGPSYENFFSHKKNVYEIQVEQKFSGSKELFDYHPNGYTYGSIYESVYRPFNNSVVVYVQVEKLEKSLAISEFKNKMQLTYNFISQNNNYVDSVNKNLENYVKATLHKHYEDLNNLYS